MLSEHFSLEELTRSETAARKGIDNTPPPDAVVALRMLATQVLEPLREAYGKPITVNSGYRSPELNRVVGGVPSSQHTRGEAADLSAGSVEENGILFDLAKGLSFDQLIWENGGAWVHVSFSNTRNRGQVLSIG